MRELNRLAAILDRDTGCLDIQRPNATSIFPYFLRIGHVFNQEVLLKGNIHCRSHLSRLIISYPPGGPRVYLPFFLLIFIQ